MSEQDLIAADIDVTGCGDVHDGQAGSIKFDEKGFARFDEIIAETQTWSRSDVLRFAQDRMLAVGVSVFQLGEESFDCLDRSSSILLSPVHLKFDAVLLLVE
jgi:hypothetical protein